MSLYQIIILGVLVVLSGVFSGMETAVMSLNEAKVRALVKQKKKGWGREDGRTLLEIVNLSPPIGSKLRKIYN